ncbi:MAG TPA: very short patch repair endonuclease [Mycobacteriales bacterium]|jgi:DNA mismatch endonuclease (patch repair protein)
MQGNRKRDTRPELALRRELHRRGLRYLVDAPLPLAGLRRRSDVTFTRLRLVVFVDGCFWHGCHDHGTSPSTNATYWVQKIKTNIARDRDTDARLTEMGWAVLRVWEHEAVIDAATRVEVALRELDRKRAGGRGSSDTDSDQRPCRV